MATNLQVEKAVSSTAQSVKDQNGNTSSLTLSTDKVGIGTTNPADTFHIKGFARFEDTNTTGHGRIGFDDGSGDSLFIESPVSNKNITFWTNNAGAGSSEKVRITAAGNVGIGTTNPLRALQIGPSINAAFTFEPADASPNAGYIRFGDNTGWKLHFGRSREASILNAAPLNTGTTGVLMTLQDNGNVGIGTSVPREKLEVNGNILTTGAVFQGDVEVTGDIRLINADCAEDFDICETEQVEPGTVMILGEEGVLYPSQQAYDKRVAGVISGAGNYKPGIVLDKQESSNSRKPIALLGKVFCKVDAGHGAIEIGDLLTTSPTSGHAMKADDPLKAFGTVIGKALRPLAEGQGLIPILIALQ